MVRRAESSKGDPQLVAARSPVRLALALRTCSAGVRVVSRPVSGIL